MQKIKTLIFGLGKIGLDYDYDIKDRKVILTHSKALYLNRKFKIIAGIDKSSKQLLKFRSKYNIRTFRSIYDFIKFNNNNKIDLIILSTDTKNRLKDFKNILELKPKVVLIEKPISYNLSDTKKILKISKKNKIKLFVNFTKLSDPACIKIKKMISKNKIKYPIEGTACYSGGLYNNASHLISLLIFWLGDIKKLKILENGKKFNKFDLEPKFYLIFNKASIFFFPVKYKNYFNLSVELYSKNCKLSYKEEGRDVYWQSIINDNLFKGYKILNNKRKKIVNKMKFHQANIYNNIYNFFCSSNYTLCSSQEALVVDKVLNKIKLNVK